MTRILGVLTVLIVGAGLSLAISPTSAQARPEPRQMGAKQVGAKPVDMEVVQVRYIVRSGDTLSAIAKREYGSASKWPALWWVNRHHIANPNVIRIGQSLKLSGWRPTKAWLLRAALAAIPKPPSVPAATVATTPVAHSHSAPVITQSFSAAPGSFQACVIQRESGGNPTAVNPTSGAGGLYQFLPSTWASLGYAAQYPGGAQTAPVSVQNAAFQKLYAEAGASPWAPYDGC